MRNLIGLVATIKVNSYAFTILVLMMVLLLVVFIILFYSTWNAIRNKDKKNDSEEDNKNKLKGDHKLPMSTMLKRTFYYIKPQLWRFVLAFALILAQVGFDVIFPMFMKEITDELQTESPVWSYILGFGLGYLGLVVVGQIVLYFERR